MGLGISWKKAAIISAVVHLIALFIAVIFFVVVPAIQEMDTYEIDLTQSVLDDGALDCEYVQFAFHLYELCELGFQQLKN